MSTGKKEFYSKAEEALKSRGYDYYDGDRDIHGKGRQHANKPDYIAARGSKVFRRNKVAGGRTKIGQLATDTEWR